MPSVGFASFHTKAVGSLILLRKIIVPNLWIRFGCILQQDILALFMVLVRVQSTSWWSFVLVYFRNYFMFTDFRFFPFGNNIRWTTLVVFHYGNVVGVTILVLLWPKGTGEVHSIVFSLISKIFEMFDRWFPDSYSTLPIMCSVACLHGLFSNGGGYRLLPSVRWGTIIWNLSMFATSL